MATPTDGEWMNEPKKPAIFISYAHEDEPENSEGEVKWLSFVTGHLGPAVKHGAADIWIDQLMRGGADWEREIERKLRACDVFVLLVSHHSLSSDYVVDKEIAIIRERQAEGEDVHFYPLLLTPTSKIALDAFSPRFSFVARCRVRVRGFGGSEKVEALRRRIALGRCRPHSAPQARIDRPVDKRRASHPVPKAVDTRFRTARRGREGNQE